MVKRVIWSANALSDRISILDYWFQKTGNKTYSHKLDKSLRDAIKHLSHFPEMGRKIEHRDERFFVMDAYLIIYSIVKNEIHVLHIWDSRRSPDDLRFV
ncbi:MAG: type II toxin-antitoxin system RelE/ParE family toxin [Bacteroidales bacterium]|nr:type II toxin-antitoxin system RelE/ParE family toxin [Bacteroidales bacterium]